MATTSALTNFYNQFPQILEKYPDKVTNDPWTPLPDSVECCDLAKMAQHIQTISNLFFVEVVWSSSPFNINIHTIITGYIDYREINILNNLIVSVVNQRSIYRSLYTRNDSEMRAITPLSFIFKRYEYGVHNVCSRKEGATGKLENIIAAMWFLLKHSAKTDARTLEGDLTISVRFRLLEKSHYLGPTVRRYLSKDFADVLGYSEEEWKKIEEWKEKDRRDSMNSNLFSE